MAAAGDLLALRTREHLEDLGDVDHDFAAAELHREDVSPAPRTLPPEGLG